MVAQAAVNRCVTGSSPVTGARYKNRPQGQGRFLYPIQEPVFRNRGALPLFPLEPGFENILP
ncbi:uncharacterized protein METZ01_LOCUS419990 [marine metagenome]|uniref:Uncharacterized protein n=1 Tax=marine metagenome TaxID=408172 RepID=A0A382X7G8_9ZZZZ